MTSDAPDMDADNIEPINDGDQYDAIIGPTTLALADAVEHAVAVIGDTDAAISSHINDCLSECRKSIGGCHDCVCGRVGVLSDTASASVNSCYGKIVSTIDSEIATAYTYLSDSYQALAETGRLDEIMVSEPVTIQPTPIPGLSDVPLPLTPLIPTGWLPTGPPPTPGHPDPGCLLDARGYQYCPPVTPTPPTLPPTSPPTVTPLPPGCYIGSDLNVHCSTDPVPPPLPPGCGPCVDGYRDCLVPADQIDLRSRLISAGIDPASIDMSCIRPIPETHRVACESPPPPPGCPPCPPGATITPPTATLHGITLCDPAHLVDNVNTLMSGLTSSGFSGIGSINIGESSVTGSSILSIIGGVAGLVASSNTGMGYITDIVNVVSAAKDRVLKSLQTITGCDLPAFASAASLFAGVGFIERWTGALPEAITQSLTYATNYTCQFRLPSTQDLNVLVVNDWISDEQWQTGVKLQGDCVKWQELLVENAYVKPDITGVISLERRKLIEYDEAKKRLFKLGIKDEDTISEFYTLTQQLPSMQDVILYMTRDVGDPDAVQENELDTDFDVKYSDKLKEWMDTQGVPEEVAKYSWRAHWQYPSNTAIYEMVRRLRPDRKKTGGEFDDVDVTIEDAEKVLKVNDTAPKWVRPLLAVSYATLTRVDIRRMHCIGVIEDDDLADAYQNIGYNKTDADSQAEFTKRLNKESQSCNRTGFTVAKIMSLYKDGGFREDEAKQLLQTMELPDDQVQSLIDGADTELMAKSKILQKKALRKRYLMGDMEHYEAESMLMQAGFDLSQANNYVSDWDAEKRFKYKQPAATILCKWWSSGLLSGDDYSRRLTNLGYSPDDIARMMAMCAGDLAKRKQKDAEKAEKDAEAARKKLAAANARACKARARTKKTYQQICDDLADPGNPGYDGPVITQP